MLRSEYKVFNQMDTVSSFMNVCKHRSVGSVQQLLYGTVLSHSQAALLLVADSR